MTLKREKKVPKQENKWGKNRTAQLLQQKHPLQLEELLKFTPYLLSVSLNKDITVMKVHRSTRQH